MSATPLSAAAVDLGIVNAAGEPIRETELEKRRKRRGFVPRIVRAGGAQILTFPTPQRPAQ